MRDDLPLALLLVFVPFSLLSIGGGASVLAGIQHEVVDVHHWVTAREFVDLFALSRAAPGPGTMLATAQRFQRIPDFHLNTDWQMMVGATGIEPVTPTMST